MKEFSAKNYTVLITWLKHNICQIQQQISMRKERCKQINQKILKLSLTRAGKKQEKLTAKHFVHWILLIPCSYHQETKALNASNRAMKSYTTTLWIPVLIRNYGKKFLSTINDEGPITICGRKRKHG